MVCSEFGVWYAELEREKVQGPRGEIGRGNQGRFYPFRAIVMPYQIGVLAPSAFHHAPDNEVGVFFFSQRLHLHIPPEFGRELIEKWGD